MTVTPPIPRLGVVRILAFGDSITEGEVPAGPGAGEGRRGEVVAPFIVRPMFVELASSYPADLTTSLAARYTAQGATRVDALTLNSDNSTDCWTDPAPPTTTGILVINAGGLGEAAEAPNTLARLNDKIAVYRPDLVLLLEGTNDLDPANPDTSIANGVQGVVTLVGAIRAQGTPVMVGTLLPEIAADLTHGGAPDLIVPFNSQLVPAVTSAGARLVDTYSDIAADVADWVSPYDGVHLTEAGYAELARVWFAAIRNNFEVKPSGAATTNRAVRAGNVMRSPASVR